MQRVSIIISPRQMTPDSQPFRFVYMSACDDDLDLQGTEAKWSPQWCPRLAELCSTGMVMHVLNMNLHLSKQVSSTFCGVMFALLIVNIQQFCKAMLACSVLLVVGPDRVIKFVTACHLCIKLQWGYGMAAVQAALGYIVTITSTVPAHGQQESLLALSEPKCKKNHSCKGYVFSAERQTHLAFIQKR